MITKDKRKNLPPEQTRKGKQRLAEHDAVDIDADMSWLKDEAPIVVHPRMAGKSSLISFVDALMKDGVTLDDLASCDSDPSEEEIEEMKEALEKEVDFAFSFDDKTVDAILNQGKFLRSVMQYQHHPTPNAGLLESDRIANQLATVESPRQRKKLLKKLRRVRKQEAIDEELLEELLEDLHRIEYEEKYGDDLGSF